MEDYIKGLVGGIIAILIIATLSCAWYYHGNKWQKDVGREIFKESITYNESAAEFLADAYYQYNTKESDSEKEQICAYVRTKYPNLDTSKIDNSELRNFYSMCVSGKVKRGNN